MTCSICNKPTDIFNPRTLCICCKKSVCYQCADTFDSVLERRWGTGGRVCKNCEFKGSDAPAIDKKHADAILSDREEQNPDAQLKPLFDAIYRHMACVVRKSHLNNELMDELKKIYDILDRLEKSTVYCGK